MRWIGLLQCISGVTAVVLVLRCMFGYTPKKRCPTFPVALCLAAAAETGILLLSRRDTQTADLLQEVLTLACSVAFPYTLLRCSRKRTFLLFAVTYCATIDYIVSLIPTRHIGAVYILIDVLACLPAVIVFLSDRKAPSDFLDEVPVWVFIAVSAADLSAYYSGMLHRDASYSAGVSVALKVIALVLICVSIFVIARRYLALQRAERTAEKQLAMQLRHYEELVEKNRSVRAFRHDYENNLLSLGAILDSGNTQEARDYVQTLQRDVHAAGYAFTTGNYLADAILSDKAEAAKEKGIQITAAGTVPQKGIANPDLCTILCNLLDNAIRGSEPCAPCTVELDGQETADRWLLTIKNPVVQKVAIRGGKIRTSKADAENHGIGIANVRHTAEKYNGYLDLGCDDHRFTAEVGMMLNTEERK